MKHLIHTYRHVFKKLPGKFKNFEYKFDFKDKAPYCHKSYPVPFKYIEKIDDEINCMLEFSVIESGWSEFINPIITVIKKNGIVRLCIDGRELNTCLISDHDGPEDMDDTFRKCSNIKIMSSFDLTASFCQIPLAKESRKYTAFTHRGMRYQHTVVPFGTKVSSAALTRASEALINDLKDFIINFVDDWLCVSESFEDYLMHVEILLERCLSEGISSNFAKIEF